MGCVRRRAATHILGVLLDAVVQGLKMLPNTTLERLPRMADFALWATACETALWPAGTFSSAYSSNRNEAVENGIEADPIAAAVRAVMEERTEWTGTATDLLGALAEAVGERVAKSKTWPGSPRALSGRLRRAATFLAQDRHRDRPHQGRPGTHQGYSHQGRRKFRRPGLSRAATVRTVRIVREPTERQWNQRIRGKQEADGWRACGR